MFLTALSPFGHIPIEDFFFLQVMSIPLFPEGTGLVEDCQTSLGIILDDSITQHMLFELAIDVQGRFSSKTQQRVEFCKLLRRILQDVPTDDSQMEVLWRKVLRMLEAYRKSIKTAQKKRKFDRNWSPDSNPGLRRQLEAPFQINPPQVLRISNALPL